MIKNHTVITEFDLEGSERFLWEKHDGRFEGREFTVTEIKVEVHSDETRNNYLTLRGPWLTPLAKDENEHIRINGWESIYEFEWDFEKFEKLAGIAPWVLEWITSTGLKMSAPSR